MEEEEEEEEEGEEGNEDEEECEEVEAPAPKPKPTPKAIGKSKRAAPKAIKEKGGRSDKGKKRRKITKLKLEDGVRKIMMNSRWHSLEENVSDVIHV